MQSSILSIVALLVCGSCVVVSGQSGLGGLGGGLGGLGGILNDVPVVGGLAGSLGGLGGLGNVLGAPGVGHGPGNIGAVPSGYDVVPSGVYYQDGSHAGYFQVDQSTQTSNFLFSGLGSALSCTSGSVSQILNYHTLSGLCEFEIPNLAVSNLQLNTLGALSVHADTSVVHAIFQGTSFTGTIKVSLSVDVLPVLGALGLGSLLNANIDLVVPLSLSLLGAGQSIPSFGC